MRRLSHATPLDDVNSAKSNADCVFEGLFEKIMDYKRARHPYPEPGMSLSVKMSQLLKTDIDCPICNNIRRNLCPGGLPHRNLEYYEENYGHANMNVGLRGATISIHEHPGWRLAELLPVKGNAHPLSD
jgi:hypothetical protein